MGRRRPALAMALAATIVAVAVPARATALDKHLCGIYGTVLNPQEVCPGDSPRHSWKRATGYRQTSSGIDMCIVVRDGDNKYLFHRCSFWATSIYIPPSDLNNGHGLKRIRNKNNNVTLGTELRYLYASTE